MRFILATLLLLTLTARGAVTQFNVLSFGARGDGSHDDTSAINAAISAATAAGGASIVFPGGTYPYSGTITKPNVTIELLGMVNAGSSSTNVTIKFTRTDGGDGIVVSGGTAANQFTLRAIRLLGNISAGIGLRFTSPAQAGILVEDVVVSGFGSHGISMSNCNGFHFNRVSSLSNGGDGWHLDHVTGLVGQSNFSIGNTGYGAYLTDVTSNDLQLTVQNNGYNILLTGVSANNHLYGLSDMASGFNDVTVDQFCFLNRFEYSTPLDLRISDSGIFNVVKARSSVDRYIPPAPLLTNVFTNVFTDPFFTNAVQFTASGAFLTLTNGPTYNSVLVQPSAVSGSITWTPTNLFKHGDSTYYSFWIYPSSDVNAAGGISTGHNLLSFKHQSSSSFTALYPYDSVLPTFKAGQWNRVVLPGVVYNPGSPSSTHTLGIEVDWSAWSDTNWNFRIADATYAPWVPEQLMDRIPDPKPFGSTGGGGGGGDVSFTSFNPTYFSTNSSVVSLKGETTNWFKLTTNLFITLPSFDGTYFSTNSGIISLLSNLTNWFKLGTNSFLSTNIDTLTVGTLNVLTNFSFTNVTASRIAVFDSAKNITNGVNGTDGQILIYDTPSVGHVKFTNNSAGTVTATNVHFSVPIQVQSLNIAGTNKARIDASTTNWRLLFTPSSNNTAVAQFQMPSNYVSGGTVTINWASVSATSGNAVWSVEVMAVSPGDAVDINTESYDTANTTTTATPGTAGFMTASNVVLNNNDSWAASDFIKLRFSVTSASTLNAGDCFALTMTFNYVGQ